MAYKWQTGVCGSAKIYPSFHCYIPSVQLQSEYTEATTNTFCGTKSCKRLCSSAMMTNAALNPWIFKSNFLISLVFIVPLKKNKGKKKREEKEKESSEKKGAQCSCIHKRKRKRKGKKGRKSGSTIPSNIKWKKISPAPQET
jgi:hypothetical protein